MTLICPEIGRKKIQNESNDSVAFSAEFSHLSDYTS